MRRFIKRAIALLPILILMAGSAIAAAQEPELIPIRATFEAMGAEVEWGVEDRRITIVLADNIFVLFADSQRAYVNNEAITLHNNVFIDVDRSFMHLADFEYMTMPQAFFSEEVIIGEGGRWPLGGTLTMPVEASAENPVPVVLLVHGSGPLDRNLTIGVNHAFHDIAAYLSSNGIAVFRYDKRTLVHGAELEEEYGTSFTVWEETIEDAIFAADFLRLDPRIDSDRIYMAGISLGGMLAPRIHASGGDFAGLIMLAGSPRQLFELGVDQSLHMIEVQRVMLQSQVALLEMMLETEDFEMLGEFDPAARDLDDTMAMEHLLALLWEADAIMALLDAEEEAIEEFLEIVATLADKTQEEAKVAMAGAWPAYYLRDMIMHPTPGFLAEITVPMLIMHGDNDFQVFTEADFMLFMELLGDRDNVTFHLYPGLNHIFMPSVATHLNEAVMEMMMVPAQVHPQVLRDIVNWVLAR